MAKLISKQVIDFLDSLECALQLPSEQSRRIVDEVRADLSEHIQRFVEKGNDEETAVALALDEMGSPDELARHMSAAVPPLNGPAVRLLRRSLTVLLTLLIAWIFWDYRANCYGFSFTRALAIGMVFLPIVLLTWPSVIWRSNWMFSVLPSAAIFIVIILLMSTGQSSSTTLIISPDTPGPVPSYPADPRDGIVVSATGYTILGLLATLTIYLMAMMQRKRQRIAAIFAAMLLVAFAEIPYAFEEHHYAARLDQIRTKLGAYRNEHRAYPTEDQFKANQESNQEAKSFRYHIHPSSDDYYVYWTRPLSRGYSLCYTSNNHQMWIND